MLDMSVVSCQLSVRNRGAGGSPAIDKAPLWERCHPGGIGSGGFNFDAKPRRGSFDEIDLFYAHVSGMDTFARGLLAAHQIIEDGVLDDFISFTDFAPTFLEVAGVKIPDVMTGKSFLNLLKRE